MLNLRISRELSINSAVIGPDGSGNYSIRVTRGEELPVVESNSTKCVWIIEEGLYCGL
jgi:hypothetical protein